MKPLVKIRLVVFANGQFNVVRRAGFKYFNIAAVEVAGDSHGFNPYSLVLKIQAAVNSAVPPSNKLILTG
ncbi:hypothetical protein GCM10027181_11950 [Rheinheimera gaetbuli]